MDSGPHPRDPARETTVIVDVPEFSKNEKSRESESAASSSSDRAVSQEQRFVAVEIQSLLESKGVLGEHRDQHLEKNLEKEEDLRQCEDDKEQEARICRVCHLSLHDRDREHRDDDPEDPIDNKILSRGGLEAIELGCACKDDLAFAHRRCAETWFKIKGNRNCEICGRVAQNVVGCCGDPSFTRGSDEQSDSIYEQQFQQQGGDQARGFWQHRPICNFVLAFIVVILLLPWLFRIRLF